MYTFLLILHILAGTLALGSGAVAILSVKGRKTHSRSGSVYSYSMYAVAASAILLSLLKFNSFLLSIGIFSIYLTYSGNRALFYFRLRKSYKTGLADWLPPFIGFSAALFMFGYPLWQMLALKQFFVPVLSVFGLILLLNSAADLLILQKHPHLQPGQRQWLLKHIGMMGGAYISTFTAFAVTNIRLEQQWLVWVLPTIIGSFFISKAIKQWRAKLKLQAA